MVGRWKLAAAESGRPVDLVEQLRSTLTRRIVRTVDCFREWDTSIDGTLSKAEFEVLTESVVTTSGAAAIGPSGEEAAVFPTLIRAPSASEGATAGAAEGAVLVEFDWGH